jgi:hypothetical protein
MNRKLIAAILSVFLILLAFNLFSMGLQIYELQDRVSELNTRIAYLEYKVSPHLEFIRKSDPIDVSSEIRGVVIEKSPDATR